MKNRVGRVGVGGGLGLEGPFAVERLRFYERNGKSIEDFRQESLT